LSTSEAHTKHGVFIDVPLLPPLDCEMCRVFLLVAAAAALAFLAGWALVGEVALVFALLCLWLAAQLAAAPCYEEEAEGR
jgi:hypothetical protein